jgi:hypothetical protein
MVKQKIELLLGRSIVWTYQVQNILAHPDQDKKRWAWLSSRPFSLPCNDLARLSLNDTYYWFHLDIFCLFLGLPSSKYYPHGLPQFWALQPAHTVILEYWIIEKGPCLVLPFGIARDSLDPWTQIIFEMPRGILEIIQFILRFMLR